jgi:Skp family chaperone for outer membrane proteins
MTAHRTILAIIMFLCIMTAPYVHAADILKQLHAYITVDSEYNDNLNLTFKNQKNDFITSISPGVKFSNMDAQSGITLDANAGAVLYNKYTLIQNI